MSCVVAGWWRSQAGRGLVERGRARGWRCLLGAAYLCSERAGRVVVAVAGAEEVLLCKVSCRPPGRCGSALALAIFQQAQADAGASPTCRIDYMTCGIMRSRVKGELFHSNLTPGIMLSPLRLPSHFHLYLVLLLTRVFTTITAAADGSPTSPVRPSCAAA